jgi:N-acyl-D-aspartate/D-glutamate deacylase
LRLRGVRCEPDFPYELLARTRLLAEAAHINGILTKIRHWIPPSRLSFGAIRERPGANDSFTIENSVTAEEKAHYKISGLPAWIAGFTDRGILREGFAADIIVYEQEKLGFLYDSPVYAADFPGGERRLIQKAKGIRYTIVNGGITFEESECT